MSKSKQLTDLIEEDNASGASPRRSSRIATRRLSSCDEIPSSPAKTRSRRTSLTSENNGTPAKLTRSKRSSLTLESNSTKDNDSNSSSPSSKKLSSPDTTLGGPAKRTRRRGSLTNSTQDESEASTPIPNRILPRRLSGRRSMSKSPTRENDASPILENINLSKVTTPKRRGRKPSVTEKVIPLEAIEETELNKVEDENNSKNTNIVSLTDNVSENVSKSENLETILESSILDSQEGADIEKNLSKKLGNSSKDFLNDAGINKSFNKKDRSMEILNDSSLNKSSKGKTLNRSSQNTSAKNNESIKDKSVEISQKDIQSPVKANVSSGRNKKDIEENNSSFLNKSKLNASNIEKAESDLLDVLNLSQDLSDTDKPQTSIDQNLSPLVIIEDIAEVNLSVGKSESVNKSNESDKENHNKNLSVVINEKSGIKKESSNLFSEPMEIDDYPPDTSDEIITKCATPNKSLQTEKEEIMLSPIISSVGKRNKQRSHLLNSNMSVFYDVACANSTPKKIVLNKEENGQSNVDSDTPSKKLKDINISTEKDSIKDKSKRNSKELDSSANLSDSKRITRKSVSLNKSAQNSEESLNVSAGSNKSKTKLNEKSNRNSKDLNESDSNEKSMMILRSSTVNASNASIDENAKEDLIDLEESVNKSTSKQNSKRKSDVIDSDQNDSAFDEKSKRQSKRKSISNENSPRKSRNLSQSINKDESASQEESKGKSKNLSQSIDTDKSIEQSLSEEKTKQKFKDLLTDKEENIEKPTSPRRSKCLSNLIDVDESDDQDDKSLQTSTRINESISRSLMKAKIAASNKSIDKLNPDIELEATINKFVESYNLMDDNDEHHALLDDQASEGEEDTPSENSCDIPVDGESLGSCDSEKALDESYEHDSFIVSDEEAELLSGNEFDLDQSKTHSRRLKNVDDGEDEDEVKNNSKAEEKKEESEKTVERNIEVQNTSVKLGSVLDPPSEKKRAVQKPVEEDSDLENMSIKPYCGLDPPSVASSRESLSEADKIEVASKKTENSINLSNISSIKSPRKSLNTSFTGSLNISVLEDKENTTRRSRTTSLLVQEQFENYNVENVCDHITKVVNMVYSDSKKENVDVSLNVSLEFTEKRKSKTPPTPNSSQDLQLITENLSSDVISVESSDEDKSKKPAKQVIHMDTSTDSDMSDDIDEDVNTKYYESRLISKEEDMLRQSSGVVKQAKPDPKFSSSSEECEAEEQENESLLKEQDKISKQSENILGVTDLVKIQQGKKRNSKEEELGKIKILQSTKLIPEKKVIPPTLKEPTDVVPSKKMKVNLENTIRKKKQKLQPSKNLTDGDNLEINYFPSKILNTIVNNEKSNKKPKIIPSKSTNQNSWVSKAASPLKPSCSIFTQKKKKLEPKINERDFKSRMLNDQSRNKRMDMETLLKMKSKMKQRVHP